MKQERELGKIVIRMDYERRGQILMIKKDLWCGYCGTQDFIGHESKWGKWECIHCHAIYEDNPGYGYFTSDWGDNEPYTLGKHCLNSGEMLDDSKLPRTPEGIVRNSDSHEKLKKYLMETQVK